MNYMNKNLIFVALVFTVVFVYTVSVFAIPLGPESMTSGPSSRADVNYSVKNTSAMAGNVTELNITANTITKSWQGYFGSITGKIVLSDGNNNKFYDWNLTVPTGEVYASPNTSVNWAVIKCFNFTAPNSAINLTTVHGWFNISNSDPDSVDKTFNNTDNALFSVGSVSITANTCPSTYTYVNGSAQSNYFQNVLLTDNSSLVFTSLINNDIHGFNTVSHDFQLLVAEDGHTDNLVTPYYFWIELS
jgi:hypothetical protein